GTGVSQPGTCASPLPLMFNDAGFAFVSETTWGHGHALAGSCGGLGREMVFTFTQLHDGPFDAFASSNDFETVLYLQSTCGGASLACAPGSTFSSLRLSSLPAGTYYLVVTAGTSTTVEGRMTCTSGSPT